MAEQNAAKLEDFILFSGDVKKRFGKDRVPMSTLYEAYFDGTIDIPGDMDELLSHRDDLVKYTITRQHLQWAFTNFVPDVVHTKTQDERLAKELYDRGAEFFESFLGPELLFSCAWFDSDKTPLADAQAAMQRRVATLLELRPEHALLDMGCGWGALTTRLAAEVGCRATGLTNHQGQTEFGRARITQAGQKDKARIEFRDYRDKSDDKFDRIACIEIVEHVGVKNLRLFFDRLRELLADDGLVVLQWTGLRRALKPEDMIWGLFVNKYIFPGADGALPLSSMLKVAEKAGFEVRRVDNTSNHYHRTLLAWRKNWRTARAQILERYGERTYRIWGFFLAWSAFVAREGGASSYQVVLSKNDRDLDRQTFKWR